MRSAVLTVAAVAGAISLASLSIGSEGAPPSTLPPALEIGSVVAPQSMHMVTRPGLYGLGDPPAGTEYAVVQGSLVRIDPVSRVIRGIIRPVAPADPLGAP